MVNSGSVSRVLLSNFRLMLGSLAAAGFFLFLLCFLFTPIWETNDDIGMSMVAHGYGIAAIGMPNLIFSNVLWGYLVRLIPEINGVLGYSIATLSVLVVVGMVIIFGLCRLGLGYVASFSAMALILVRPVLFPQYTINAGLLIVSAIVCWHLSSINRSQRALVAGCFLAFLSYLIRSQEFFLVLIVALPLLPWRTFLLCRAPQIAVLTLMLAIAVSAVIDHQTYQGDEWKSFNELNPARAPFTDFGAGGYLKQRPDILERYGYSSNDIDLIDKWFFVDPNIANPDTLKGMLGELGPLLIQGNAVASAWVGVKTLWHPILLTTILTALLLSVFRSSWQVVAVWGLCIVAVFVLGLLGRPGVLRVYQPLVFLLLIAPVLRHSSQEITVWCHRLRTGVIFVAAIANMSVVFSESKMSQASSEQIRQGLVDFPRYPVVIWGGVFPFEAVYPVLGASSAAMSYQLYGLGVFTLAPFSVATAEQKVGRGMTDLLVGESGLSIIANKQRFGYLNTYCRERLHGDLKEISIQEYGQIQVSQRRCEVVL